MLNFSGGTSRHLPTYLEHTYNELRLHSAMGCLSPVVFEALQKQPLTGQIQTFKLPTSCGDTEVCSFNRR